ncbi:MAG: LacI family transcriptional regulator [Lachnospiraceae bacterium]|nr:LacI family transcriptional regulator [Lachnospiraceae bacterium]
MEKQVTIYDISEKAGVSIATVSRVLNGNSNVKQKTRKKVLDIIEELGYTPNAFARGLGLDSMNTIGILCADSSDTYIAKAIFYIERALRENGYNTILCCTGYKLENKKKALSLLLSKRVDSIIMVGSHFVEESEEDNAHIREAAMRTPVMFLNADLDYKNVFCTLCDDYKASFEATQSLIDKGHKNVLFFYNSNSYGAKKKLSGYQAAYLQNELPVNKDLIYFYHGNNEDIQSMAECLKKLEKSGVDFDGIFASDDNLGIGAIRYAKTSGKRIPEDIAIIGYNNSMLTECSTPRLSSVDNHLETLCSQLVKTLMGILSGNEMPQKIIFSGELVNRETT